MKSVCLLWPIIMFSLTGHTYYDDFIKQRTTDQLNLFIKYIDFPEWNLNKYSNPVDNYILEHKDEPIDLDEPISIQEFFTK